ncbi:hypothetical protein J6590_083970 [Homalodisca vitripennis]|nr:hypothetical protein J6590_083970 [Homalodisca vitripennis]
MGGGLSLRVTSRITYVRSVAAIGVIIAAILMSVSFVVAFSGYAAVLNVTSLVVKNSFGKWMDI